MSFGTSVRTVFPLLAPPVLEKDANFKLLYCIHNTWNKGMNTGRYEPIRLWRLPTLEEGIISLVAGSRPPLDSQ